MPRQSSPRNMKRSQKACTSCRQVKLRCDTMQTFPAPCSRCKKNSLECRTDPTFKRTRTRHRLEEVNNQLAAIQNTLGLLPLSSGIQAASPPSSTSGMSRRTGQSTGELPVPVDFENVRNALLEPFFRQTSKGADCLCSPVTLGQIIVENSQVEILFKHFEKYYYRHCPIFDTHKSLSALHRSSPFLFWTIVIISSRWHPDLGQLYNKLVSAYRDLLGKTLIGPISDLETLQGLILLCFWPLSVRKQSEDPSWNYCGLITNVALRMGLQRTETGSKSSQDQSHNEVVRVRAKTWMACLQLNSIYIWYFGLSVPSELLNAKLALGSLSQVEKVFVAKTQVQRQSVKFALLLSRSKHDGDCLSFVQILLKDLDDIKEYHRDTWVVEAELVLLGVQLNIYAFQLQQISVEQQGSLASSEYESSKKILMQGGFTAAVRLIHTFSEITIQPNAALPQPSQEAPSFSTRHLPKHYFTLLLFATSFIFKITVSNLGSNTFDNDIASNHIRLTHRILLSYSAEPMDEASRAARMIEVLSKAQCLSQLRLKERSVNGHMSLSLLEDVILTAREIRESPGETAGSDFNPDSQQDTPSSIDTSAYNEELANIAGAASVEDLEANCQGLYDFDWNAPWGFNLPIPDMFNFQTDSQTSDGTFA